MKLNIVSCLLQCPVFESKLVFLFHFLELSDCLLMPVFLILLNQPRLILNQFNDLHPLLNFIFSRFHYPLHNFLSLVLQTPEGANEVLLLDKISLVDALNPFLPSLDFILVPLELQFEIGLLILFHYLSPQFLLLPKVFL